MRRILLLLFLFIPSLFLFAWEAPFHKGLNIASWIWSNESARKIPFSEYGRIDLERIRDLGCDVVRLPISLSYFAGPFPERNFPTLFFYFLDQVVDWAEELGIYLILDNHTQFPNSSYVPSMEDMIPLWSQLAEHYKDRSDLILYEIMNEPHNITYETWKSIQDSLIRTIRSIDSHHTIIVKPIWDSCQNYKTFEPVSDTNVIYSFHFYQPFIFTHQGASWTNPPCQSLAGVPFPAEAGEIPPCPEDLLGSYFETSLQTYDKDGTDSAMFAYMEPVLAFADSHDVPIICGEFGVYSVNAPEEDRVFWHKVFIDHLTELNIPWTIWGYKYSFGIMKNGSNQLFNHDLDPDMIESLGLIMPEQDTLLILPDTCGFSIFDDHAGWHINPSIWTKENSYNLYYTEDPAIGHHCILLQNPLEYNNIGFQFNVYRDISNLVEKDAHIKFWIKGDYPGLNFQIRFTDSNIGDPDEPNWRKGYTLDDSKVNWDNQWHELSIPLSSFWDLSIMYNGELLHPDGRFDWSKLQRFDFSFAGDKFVGAHIYFDDIRIILPEESSLEYSPIPTNFYLKNIYPNPFNTSSIINFTLEKDTYVKINIYDLNGKYIETLAQDHFISGEYQLQWHANPYPSGIYIFSMQAGSEYAYRKAVLIK